jgi:hypothetical protein
MYGLRKVKLKIKWPGRLEKTQIDKFVFSPITLKGPGAWISRCPVIVLEFNPLPQQIYGI